jgi:AraC family transcriptional regulator of adaptative response/methylated-DNA-[protein]-cysteine methyltransferase
MTAVDAPMDVPVLQDEAGHEAAAAACRDYKRIEKAIRFLDAHWRERPDLAAAARAVHLSPYHFQRLFTRWAGVSPARFVQSLAVAHARRLLAESRSVLDATLEAGLSGPGRLHDLFVAWEALSPGEFKRRGAGVVIRHGVHPGPFGEVLVLASPRGVCGLDFVDGAPAAAVERARARWPAARFVADPAATAGIAARIFPPPGARPALALHLAGTNFQVKVWEALLRVPPGRLVSYEDVGRAIGRPGCARAIGNAMAANPVAFLVPCHRVIRATGVMNDYRWGLPRRKAMIGWEQARFAAAAAEGGREAAG